MRILIMDPYTFFGALLGAMIAAQPGHAGVVCDRRGFCVEQPQFARPYYPPAPVYIPQPRYQDPPPPSPRPQQDALGARVKGEIYEFCSRHPEEQFCGDLNSYLDKHPDAR
jgi:hypothetical protein